MKHATTIRVESRPGMKLPDYRIICTCGYTEKALNNESAEQRAIRHRNRPN